MNTNLYLIIYLLSTIGGTHIVVRSDIFKHMRRRFYVILMIRRRRKYLQKYIESYFVKSKNHHYLFSYRYKKRRRIFSYNTVLGCSLCFGFHAGWMNAVWMYLIYIGVLPAQCLIVNAALCTSICSQVMYLIIKKLAY